MITGTQRFWILFLVITAACRGGEETGLPRELGEAQFQPPTTSPEPEPEPAESMEPESSALEPQFTLSQGGTQRTLHERDTPGLLQEMIDSLEAADGVLRLAVPNDLVGDLKAKGVATLEVKFKSRRVAVLAQLSGTSIEYSQLLIPLDGDWVNGVTTIFYGTGGYSHGPVRRIGAPARLLEILAGQ